MAVNAKGYLYIFMMRIKSNLISLMLVLLMILGLPSFVGIGDWGTFE